MDIIKHEPTIVVCEETTVKKNEEIDVNNALNKAVDMVNNVLSLASDAVNLTKAIVQAEGQIKIAEAELQKTFVDLQNKQEARHLKKKKIESLSNALDSAISKVFSFDITSSKITEDQMRLVESWFTMANNIINELAQINCD